MLEGDGTHRVRECQDRFPWPRELHRTASPRPAAGPGISAILAAIPPEFRHINSAVKVLNRERVGPCSARLVERGGRTALLVLTGVGPAAASASAKAILESRPVSTLLSIGYAGAVQSWLQVGDLVGIETLRFASATNRGSTGSEPRARISRQSDNELFLWRRSDAALLDAAERLSRELGLRWRRGASLTVNEVIAEPEKKLLVGATTGVSCVEMESAAIAEVAAMHGLRYAALRSISDTVADRLPTAQPGQKYQSIVTAPVPHGAPGTASAPASMAGNPSSRSRGGEDDGAWRRFRANTELAAANLATLVLALLDSAVI